MRYNGNKCWEYEACKGWIIAFWSLFRFSEAMNVSCRFRKGNCFIEALSNDWSKLNCETSEKRSSAFLGWLMIGMETGWLHIKSHAIRCHVSFWYSFYCRKWFRECFQVQAENESVMWTFYNESYLLDKTRAFKFKGISSGMASKIFWDRKFSLLIW